MIRVRVRSAKASSGDWVVAFEAYVANSNSRGSWGLEQASTVLAPAV